MNGRKQNDKRIALIGLDTSHTVAFTKLMQSPNPEERVVEGMRAVRALRFPSSFQSEEGQDERQEQLEALGVQVTTDIREAVQDVDAVFLEINDPALHWTYFEQVAHLGLPVFIDKPLAGTLEDADNILALADKEGTPVWSASSLRFIPSLSKAKETIPSPVAGHTFGPLGQAAKGSDLVWYGIHAVEMVTFLLGADIRAVRALNTGGGVTILPRYADGTQAVVECLRGLWQYGGRLQDKENLVFFDTGGESPYQPLMSALRDFVCEGIVPVSLEHARTNLAVLLAAETSLAENREIEL
ncbi:MAG: Gfo/Idh/MocA family oxidoreductase [Candidatus Pacebacteria bacterium]|nr:Gfo/Idh/MocA family oxidoreductase [Candidatus Paceibacterota bacterium]